MANQNIDYYNNNADFYFEKTINIDMSVARGRFLDYLPEGGKILDAGCGSGRDSKAFLEADYKVEAFDASIEMCKKASQYVGIEVRNLRFDEISYDEEFDGIWACASLHHVANDELPAVLTKMNRALKIGGAIFASFKNGNGVITSDGRKYSDYTRESLKALFKKTGFSIVSIWGGDSSKSDKYIGEWLIIIGTKIADDKEHSYKLTIDQERALKVMRSGRNVFLSGAAGTGKSFLIKEYLKENKDKNVLVCAPTGLAAVNIGGVTLNRLFYVPTEITEPGSYTKSSSMAVKQADIIIIDEISMCRIDTFEYIIRTLHDIYKQKKETNDSAHIRKQVIVVGDFYQLPPVLKKEKEKEFEEKWGIKRGEDLFAYNSTLWEDMLFVNIILKAQVRQSNDLEYLENLNKIRVGDSSGIEWFNTHVQRTPLPDAVYICGTNAEADSINQSEGEKLTGDYIVYSAVIEGKASLTEFSGIQELKLKCGMRVMTILNNGDEYQNGSLGQITALDEDCIGIKLFNGKDVNVKQHTWETYDYVVKEDKVEKVQIGSIKQFPIKIAYAITIHKSQGQTFSAVNISPKCFDRGQLYVALSRVKKIENMSISSDIKKEYLRTSRAVYDFYDDLDDELLGWEFDEHKWDDVNCSGIELEPRCKEQNYKEAIRKVNANAYYSWTDEEDQKLREELNRSLSVADISRAHGRTIGAIRARMIKLFDEE